MLKTKKKANNDIVLIDPLTNIFFGNATSINLDGNNLRVLPKFLTIAKFPPPTLMSLSVSNNNLVIF